MFFSSFYKKILNNIPTATIVLDVKGKVCFSNAAFRRYFPSSVKEKGELSEVIGCTYGHCGSNNGCAACRLKLLCRDVCRTGAGCVNDIGLTISVDGKTRERSLRIRLFPLDRKRCIGVAESVYEEELQKELIGAQNIQQRLLPVGKEAGGVPYSYIYIPCREIGGDLPDVYEVNTLKGKNTFGVLADVAGKGLAAGMLSSFVKAAFDRSDSSPAGAITRLNEKFRELNLDEKAYITVAAVRIDSVEHEIYYSIAGHNAPILLRSGDNVSEIEMPAPPVSNWFEAFDYRDEKLKYYPHDVLVLLTDGVTESKNATGEQFGIERVENVLLRSKNAQEFVNGLQTALQEFCGTFDDDITAIAFDL